MPAEKQPPCQQVGGVNYRYGIGQLEVTVAQYVAFLNTADPAGRNRHKLYSSNESSSEWPKYGQINFSAGAATGHHYSVASPEWADKPYGFANFLRSARFANSLYNGRLLSKHASANGGFSYVTYRVRLSRRTERGMYDMKMRAMTRSHKRGFVIPSQNEWIKAAYYDPSGGGKYSYWQYPTNPGAFGDEGASRAALDHARPDHRRRHQRLDPAAGELPRSKASRRRAGARRPSAPKTCSSVNPVRDRPDHLRKGLPGQPRARSARRRPPRPGGRSTRAATRSSGPTRSPRRRRAAAAPTAASGAACTAASPTPPSTSSGSRRSACSRRTTPSTPPPTRGWASASACSAT